MTEKEIFIVAPYPTLENIKDGMVQRIKVIDDLLINHKRVYINLALTNPVYKKIIHNKSVTELIMNPLIPLFIIFKFLTRAKTIYIHSIHPFKYLFYYPIFISKKRCNIILDAHGSVPEEINLYGKKVKYRYMLWIERLVFKNLSHCICVSNAMAAHFKARYSDLSIAYHILFTSELLPTPAPLQVNQLAVTLGIQSTDVVIIYSGNTQLWQNIPTMLDSIKALNASNVKIIILTGNIPEFKRLLEEKEIDTPNLILRSVLPAQLGAYYQLAHYGYILRDDIIVNRVANPTKMLEYLQFGIKPIVLTPHIGDYLALGYEYISLPDLNSSTLVQAKSKKNISIADEITHSKSGFNVEAII